MKGFALALAFLASPALAAEKKAALDYSGWHCAKCGPKLERALTRTKAVKSAIATLDRVTVVFDDRFLDLDQLATTIEAAGPYKVTSKKLIEPTPTPSPVDTPTP